MESIHYFPLTRRLVIKGGDAGTRTFRDVDTSAIHKIIGSKLTVDLLAADRPAGWAEYVLQGDGLLDEPLATAYFEAYATYEHADAAPSWASMEITQRFAVKLEELRRLCVTHGLTQVQHRSSPTWGPKGIEDDVSLENPVLVVTEWAFWFEEAAKHAPYSFQTRIESIDTFQAHLMRHPRGEPLVFGREGLLDASDEEEEASPPP